MCSTEQKGDEPEEGVTSEGRMFKLSKPVNYSIKKTLLMNCHCPLPIFSEFDKFLEERAKAADAALPSPPRGEPSVPLNAPSSSRKKAERTEDNLFAL